ncbi:hypothetical protein ACJX0J_007874, partial [Zea mays]
CDPFLNLEEIDGQASVTKRSNSSSSTKLKTLSICLVEEGGHENLKIILVPGISSPSMMQYLTTKEKVQQLQLNLHPK